MKAVLAETPWFSRQISDYFPSDQAYAEFQSYLMENPDAGDVVKGCGGIRKVRWPDPSRGKGKRGGLRIHYLHVPEANRFLLMDIYDKNEAADLTVDERALLARVAADYRAAAIRRKRGAPDA